MAHLVKDFYLERRVMNEPLSVPSGRVRGVRRTEGSVCRRGEAEGGVGPGAGPGRESRRRRSRGGESGAGARG